MAIFSPLFNGSKGVQHFGRQSQHANNWIANKLSNKFARFRTHTFFTTGPEVLNILLGILWYIFLSMLRIRILFFHLMRIRHSLWCGSRPNKRSKPWKSDQIGSYSTHCFLYNSTLKRIHLNQDPRNFLTQDMAFYQFCWSGSFFHLDPNPGSAISFPRSKPPAWDLFGVKKLNYYIYSDLSCTFYCKLKNANFVIFMTKKRCALISLLFSYWIRDRKKPGSGINIQIRKTVLHNKNGQLKINDIMNDAQTHVIKRALYSAHRPHKIRILNTARSITKREDKKKLSLFDRCIRKAMKKREIFKDNTTKKNKF